MSISNQTQKKISLVIPARNEEGCIEKTVIDIIQVLHTELIPFDIVLVDDNSTDQTYNIMEKLAKLHSEVKIIKRIQPNGFGRAIKDGLSNSSGDYVAFVMGDESDDPKDIIRYYRKLEDGYDCVFGSRFIHGSIVRDYPHLKLIINRLANLLIRILFLCRENDITNAFKAYKMEVIQNVMPLVSNHFNITVEIPLKAIIRLYKVSQISINWYGRTSGVSKLKLRELSRHYLFTVLYCWLEKLLILR